MGTTVARRAPPAAGASVRCWIPPSRASMAATLASGPRPVMVTQVGPLVRPLEIGDVGLDLLKLKGSLLVGEVLVDEPRVDVIEGDPLQNVLRRVVDGHGHAGYAPDDPQEGVSQAAGRQRDHAVRVGGGDALQHHGAFLSVGVTGKEPGLKPLDGNPEVLFDLLVEVEERPAPTAGEEPAGRRGAHAAHIDQADPQLRLLSAAPPRLASAKSGPVSRSWPSP